MKVLGAVLIFAAAAVAFLKRRALASRDLKLLRALADDLAILRCGICIYRKPLPGILNEDLKGGAAWMHIWYPLSQYLASSERSISNSWRQTVMQMPEPIAIRLEPLGALMSIGGETFSRAVDEVRSELMELYRQQSARQNERLRLTAAVYFSCAALTVLVFG